MRSRQRAVTLAKTKSCWDYAVKTGWKRRSRTGRGNTGVSTKGEGEDESYRAGNSYGAYGSGEV